MVLDEQPGGFIVVYDGTGTVFAETHQTILPKIKTQVELLGQPMSDGYLVSLKNTTASLLASDTATNNEESIQPEKLPLLTKAWAVRDLSPEKAAWHYPVRLHAVVTVNTKSNRYFFAQDDSAGITVLMPEIPANLNPGDAIIIEGVSHPGGFSPIVLASNVTVTGTSPLPEAQPETLFQLATGADGSQWIEVRGVVHSTDYTSSNGLAHLSLRDINGMIRVNVPATRDPVQLQDATVRIRGACGSRANEKRQFVGFEMWASSLDEVQIEEPGVPDPLALPAQPIASLDQFHPRQTLQHRVCIGGNATLVDTNLNFFFLQDADSGVRVQANPKDQVKPGDYVIASGYPGLGDYGYLLDDASFKVISHRQMPTPKSLTSETILDPQLHDQWVQAEARFLHFSKIGTVDVLTLQVGNRIFDARFITPVSSRIKNLEAGSLLQVAGIYRVLTDAARAPKSLQLAVPSEYDVQILEEPSWWSIRHTTTVIGIMASVIGATVLWVLMLRRKVREQTASLKQSERKFRSLVEQSLVGVYIVQDGRFIYVNPRLADIFGFGSAQAMMGSTLLEDVVFWEDRPFVREQIRRRIADEVDFVHYFFRGRHTNGSAIHIEVLGSRTEFGGRPAVLGMLLDVTERKIAQDKIAEQARMLDLAGDAIVVSDLDDRISYWNQSAQRIYGWTPQQAVGGISYEKMRVNPADFQKAKQALLQDFKWHGEFAQRDAHGGEITVEARWTLVHDQQGNPESILAINTDITQAKKLEGQFLRTQRMESIGVLAGGIAHDLNNVFAPIILSCDLMQNEPVASERKILLKSILTNTQRAADLVRQILTFARGTDGRRLALQPHQVLEELRKILGDTLPKSIHLKLHTEPDVWLINADATQLHQVLMNFCLNARDAMPRGGELSVTVANLELSKHLTMVNGDMKPGNYVVFNVTDTGTGMTSETRERIFDPFFTTKEFGTGTGLGLSTALGIVKSHGGFINVSSEPNQGSCFKFYLPALTNGRIDHGKAADIKPAIPRGNNELILVVDDEAPLREVAQQTLKTFGYRTMAVTNGDEAIACYAQLKNEIALVLMDMMMPVMDGPAAIKALTEINPEIKIIALSGLTNESQVQNPAGRKFLPKPYSAEQLLNAVSKVLHAKTTRRPVVS